MTARSRRREGKSGGSPNVEVETSFWRSGLLRVAGLDEVGRGPWAGPVYAAAVILPSALADLDPLSGVRDSKRLTARRREKLAEVIESVAFDLSVGGADAAEVDAVGIVPATRLAMHRALNGLALMPQALILDALTLPRSPLPQRAFPRADAYSLSVAAASIVAKVARDRWMTEIAEADYPGYGFAQHKGYGTRQHREALDRLGVCPLHRRTFRPVADRMAAGAIGPGQADFHRP